MSRRFENRSVIVTGAASGIGRATVARLGAEGARVACIDVQAEAVDAVAEDVRQAGGDARAWTTDISDQTAVEATVAEIVEAHGGLDVLCNVAGIMRAAHSDAVPRSQWDEVLATNLTGTFLVTEAALPHLLRSRGNIVMTASTASLSGHPYMLAYSATKGGLLAMTYTLAVEFAKRGLRVNAVAPGGIDTPLSRGTWDVLPEGIDEELFIRISPVDEVRGPETVAAAIAFLASDDAAHVNGDILRVDGAALA